MARPVARQPGGARDIASPFPQTENFPLGARRILKASELSLLI
jgi:hypothetical protein